MNEVILDVAYIIKTSVYNDITSAQIWYYVSATLTGVLFFVLILTSLFKKKIQEYLLFIFVGLFAFSVICFYIKDAAEQATIDSFETNSIKRKISKLIEKKNLDKDIVKDIGKKILFCHHEHFIVSPNHIDCAIYNKTPKKIHILKNLDTIGADKIDNRQSDGNKMNLFWFVIMTS